jgi:hypothetical protein
MGVPEDNEARGHRSSGLLRVPFVRRCTLEFEDGRSQAGFVVNINILGAYVARDDVSRDAATPAANLPRPGENVVCRFLIPGRQAEIRVRGAVSWVNVQQQHPVHSLPPGFGIRFEGLSDADRSHIEEVVEDYLSRQGTR